MIDHLSKELIEGYHQRKIAPTDLLALDSHLSQCDECRQRLVESRRIDAACQSLIAELRATEREEIHADHERLSAYVMGELDEDEHLKVQSHIKTCAMCAEEARELREYDAALGSYKTYEPPRSLREKLQGFRRSVLSARALRLALGPLAAILIVAITLPVLLNIMSGRQGSPVDLDRERVGSPTQIPRGPVAPPAGQGGPTAPPDRLPAPSPEFAVRLAPIERGEGAPRRYNIIVKDVTEVRIRVEDVRVEDRFGNRYASYSAILETADGQTVWRGAGLRAAGASVILSIPARLLESGDYALSLYGHSDQDARPIGKCALRIVR
ncbi:MAG: zf-HC2 domain-containing protein [Acidobacteriota bacterium]